MLSKDSVVEPKCFNCDDTGSMLLWKTVEGMVKAGYWPQVGEDGDWVVTPCVYCRDVDYWSRSRA